MISAREVWGFYVTCLGKDRQGFILVADGGWAVGGAMVRIAAGLKDEGFCTRLRGSLAKLTPLIASGLNWRSEVRPALSLTKYTSALDELHPCTDGQQAATCMLLPAKQWRSR